MDVHFGRLRNIKAIDTATIVFSEKRAHNMDVAWKTYRVAPDEGIWEPASYNIRAENTAGGAECCASIPMV